MRATGWEKTEAKMFAGVVESYGVPRDRTVLEFQILSSMHPARSPNYGLAEDRAPFND
jgi:hypothetical protein